MAVPTDPTHGNVRYNGNGTDPVDEDEMTSDSESSSFGLDELTDEEFPEHFSERDGRLFHSSPTSPYPLPVDTPEQERLTMNHDIFRLFFGSHSIGPVADLLGGSPNLLRQKMVLDMCTGNGKWPIAMAQQFPRAHIRAFDIVPIATRYPPENVRFEIHDVNNIPFRWRDGTFDLVNARDIAMAVHDYRAVLQEAVRLLRPGGLFISYEWAPHSPINLNVPPSPNYIPAIRHLHSSVNAAFHLTRNMQILSDQVRRYIVDVGAFTDITATEHLIPIGDWHTDAMLKEVGLLTLEANKRYGDSVKPLLMEAGWTGTQVDGLLEDYKQELDNTIGLNSVLVTVYATKA
ncbi:S-adenosyl-L-methionine-dependent methyltransferase [Agrocybe pediades]|nr:S-adenosyl-L-methionine-dependent methyltransferase [Agrocybe pediades]